MTGTLSRTTEWIEPTVGECERSKELVWAKKMFPVPSLVQFYGVTLALEM